MCSQQLSLLRWMNNSLISKIYYPQCLFFSKIIHLWKSYICWLNAIYKTRFFLWNTNNIDRNDVNKQNTHIKHSEKDNTGKGSNNWTGVPTMIMLNFIIFQTNVLDYLIITKENNFSKRTFTIYFNNMKLPAWLYFKFSSLMFLNFGCLGSIN